MRNGLNRMLQLRNSEPAFLWACTTKNTVLACNEMFELKACALKNSDSRSALLTKS